MKGWFDAFRADGGPTLYSFQNRTPVTEDVQSIVIYLVFTTIFVAFLIVFPGIRKERLTTFLSVILSLVVGAVILVIGTLLSILGALNLQKGKSKKMLGVFIWSGVFQNSRVSRMSTCTNMRIKTPLCNIGSGWHVAQARISSPYRAFSREKITAHLGVYIGLNSVNITLQGLPDSNLSGGIDYNERFYWTEATDFKEGYREALHKGLPFPILTVAEYLSLEEEGFCWGSRYRIAGYYCHILLWTAFAIWLLMNILFCVVPRYGAYTMIALGLLQILTNAVYFVNLPSPAMVIPFEGAALRFRFGWSFWLVFVSGVLCMVVGIVIAVIDLIFPHKFSTVLEVDYDTPFDRHIILKDNYKEKFSGKPRSITKGNDGGADNETSESKLNKRKRDVTEGHDNSGFEEELGKPSSWKMPRSQQVTTVENRRQDGSDVNIDVQAAAMW